MFLVNAMNYQDSFKQGMMLVCSYAYKVLVAVTCSHTLFRRHLLEMLWERSKRTAADVGSALFQLPPVCSISQKWVPHLSTHSGLPSIESVVNFRTRRGSTQHGPCQSQFTIHPNSIVSLNAWFEDCFFLNHHLYKYKCSPTKTSSEFYLPFHGTHVKKASKVTTAHNSYVSGHNHSVVLRNMFLSRRLLGPPKAPRTIWGRSCLHVTLKVRING